MKAGIYMRVSKKEGESIENQRKMIYDYIKKDKELVKKEYEEYTDDGISGKYMGGNGIRKLIEKIVVGEIDTVIFKDFSRFGRNYVKMGEFMEMMIPVYGVRVISVNGCDIIYSLFV